VIATCTDEVRELAAYGARPDRMYVVPWGWNATGSGLARPPGC
jgi:hypothetical protein